MSECLSDETIFLFVQGKLSKDALAAVDAHLRACADCYAVVAATARASSPEDDAAAAADGDMSLAEQPTNLVRRPRAALPALASGATVSRYEITEPLGAGAAGAVYAAYDPQLRRKVALKLVGTGRALSPGEREQLLDEARAMAQLSHPNVVNVYDAGMFDDHVFIIMELVEGTTLARWLRESARTWQEILDAFLQAGQGLAAAHAAHLVHRDFKPENVLVGLDGRVRVTDFGLARVGPQGRASATLGSVEARVGPQGRGQTTFASADASAAELASAGSANAPVATAPNDALASTVAGTPAYMAPEQFLGKAADARTDQFSFCVALYAALHGRRPFGPQAPNPGEARTLRDHATDVIAGKVHPPANTDVPESLSAALLRGLSAKPENRYPSMNELLAALRREPLSASLSTSTTGSTSASMAGPTSASPAGSIAAPTSESTPRSVSGSAPIFSSTSVSTPASPSEAPVLRGRSRAMVGALAAVLIVAVGGALVWNISSRRNSAPAASAGAPSHCGDGRLDPGEQCDDGNRLDTDGCLTTCRWAACGDGHVRAFVEECDDGNKQNDDGCSAGCLACRPEGAAASFTWDRNGHCYSRHDQPLDFASARSACARLRGELVTYNSYYEAFDVYAALLDGTRAPSWIGLAAFDRDAQPAFGWVTGELTQAAWWAPGQPTATTNVCTFQAPGAATERLAGDTVNRYRAHWTTASCSQRLAHICEQGGSLLRAQDNHAYRIVSQPATWETARADCASRGAHLATIATAEEQLFITANRVLVLWIGGTVSGADNKLTWITGEPFTHRNLGPNEPDEPRAPGEALTCLVLGLDGLWHDRKCDQTHPYVCEID